MRIIAALAALAPLASAGDPSTGWLSYAQFTSANATDIITFLSAEMVVPERPNALGAEPAFWFGLQVLEAAKMRK